MAITRTLKNSKLDVNYTRGEDDKGNAIMKRMSFSNLDLEAKPEALYAFGEAIELLLDDSVVTGFEQREESELREEIL